MIDVETTTTGQIAIVGEATVFDAARLRELLLNIVQHQHPLVALDLSQLDAIDTAGAQVLIAFKREFDTLAVHSCPPHVRSHLEQVGLVDLLL